MVCLVFAEGVLKRSLAVLVVTPYMHLSDSWTLVGNRARLFNFVRVDLFGKCRKVLVERVFALKGSGDICIRILKGFNFVVLLRLSLFKEEKILLAKVFHLFELFKTALLDAADMVLIVLTALESLPLGVFKLLLLLNDNVLGCLLLFWVNSRQDERAILQMHNRTILILF